jgi:hypothetical protein
VSPGRRGCTTDPHLDVLRPVPDWGTTPSLVTLSRVLAKRAARLDGGGGGHDAAARRPDSVALAGADLLLDEGGHDAAAGQLDAVLPASSHWVLVVVDGLGTALLERLPAWSFLRRHYQGDLRSVFPSATAACLTSLVTGMWPGEHGLLGWWTHLPVAGVTAKPLHFTDAASGRALDPETFAPLLFRGESLFARGGRRSTLYFPSEFVRSPYTAFLAGGARVHGYEDLGDLAAIVQRQVRRSCSSLSFIYFPGLDKAAHKFGITAPDTLAVLRDLDCMVAAIASTMGGATTMIVTGDHGQVDAHEGSDLVLDRRDPLLGYLVDRPSGERRLPIFHVRPDRLGDFEREFQRRFGDTWALVSAESAAAGGLLGPSPPNATARDRLGDYVAVGRDASSFRLSLDRPLKATHGGMTDFEALVPLILYSA